MLLGFDNGYVITNIFGENNVFKDSVIENIIYQPLDYRITMTVLTICNVINPPKKWTEWDVVALNIDFFGVRELKTNINHAIIHVGKINIIKESNNYILEILEENRSSIWAKFTIARIQRVTPIKHDIKL